MIYIQNIMHFEKKDSGEHSQKRELYEEKQQIVTLNFEFDSAEAYQYFHQQPIHMLPPLPHGHQWINQNHIYSIIKDKEAAEHRFDFILYGPGTGSMPYINYLCHINNKVTYSVAKTVSNNRPGKCVYPMNNKAFHVHGFSYDQPGMFKNHMRGHLIDHQDTIIRPGYTKSSLDPRNYLPEPPARPWGMDFRNKKVKQLRDNGGGFYTQHNEYDSFNYETDNHTMVPSHVRLNTFDINYNPIDIHHVKWTENFKRPAGETRTYVDYYKSSKSSSFASAPIVQYYDPFASDRDLRINCRNLLKKSQDIGKPSHHSRFIERDIASAAGEAGNFEFETEDRLVNSSIKLFDVNQSKASLTEMKRSLKHMDGLSELSNNSHYSTTTKDLGLTFFRQVGASEHIDMIGEDIESLKDAFRQHCGID